MQAITFDMDLPEDVMVDQAICAVTYLDGNGNMSYAFHIGNTTSVITLVGILETIKHHCLVSKRIGTDDQG